MIHTYRANINLKKLSKPVGKWRYGVFKITANGGHFCNRSSINELVFNAVVHYLKCGHKPKAAVIVFDEETRRGGISFCSHLDQFDIETGTDVALKKIKSPTAMHGDATIGKNTESHGRHHPARIYEIYY